MILIYRSLMIWENNIVLKQKDNGLYVNISLKANSMDFKVCTVETPQLS